MLAGMSEMFKNPDIMKSMEEMMKNMGNNPDKIVLQQEGKDPITLTMQDAVEIMNKQNKEILNDALKSRKYEVYN